MIRGLKELCVKTFIEKVNVNIEFEQDDCKFGIMKKAMNLNRNYQGYER